LNVPGVVDRSVALHRALQPGHDLLPELAHRDVVPVDVLAALGDLHAAPRHDRRDHEVAHVAVDVTGIKRAPRDRSAQAGRANTPVQGDRPPPAAAIFRNVLLVIMGTPPTFSPSRDGCGPSGECLPHAYPTALLPERPDAPRGHAGRRHLSRRPVPPYPERAADSRGAQRVIPNHRAPAEANGTAQHLTMRVSAVCGGALFHVRRRDAQTGEGRAGR
jgi:hypothetical protein